MFVHTCLSRRNRAKVKEMLLTLKYEQKSSQQTFMAAVGFSCSKRISTVKRDEISSCLGKKTNAKWNLLGGLKKLAQLTAELYLIKKLVVLLHSQHDGKHKEQGWPKTSDALSCNRLSRYMSVCCSKYSETSTPNPEIFRFPTRIFKLKHWCGFQQKMFSTVFSVEKQRCNLVPSPPGKKLSQFQVLGKCAINPFETNAKKHLIPCFSQCLNFWKWQHRIQFDDELHGNYEFLFPKLWQRMLQLQAIAK